MWGLTLSVIGLLAWGIRSCPGLDVRDQMAMRANVPIELWCEVRDQHDVPLAHETVTARLVRRGRAGNEEEKMEIQLDENGRLHIKGGDHCGITLHFDPDVYLETHYLPRWYTSLLVTSLRREAIRSDWGTADQPAICRVLRKEGPQPLVEIWGSVSFPYEKDELFYIDLLNSQVTTERMRSDLSIRIELGDRSDPVPVLNNPFLEPDTDYVPNAVHFPHRTMWVEAVDGWIEEIPNDINWYGRYVQGALPNKPAVIRPDDYREGDYGSISQQLFMFTSRNGQVSGKGIMNVFLTYGPDPDVIVFYRGVINPTGSKSFERGNDAIPVRRLSLDLKAIPINRPLRPSAQKERGWEDVFPEFSLARNPDAIPPKR